MKKRIKGSFTVEAALLMAILIPLLTTLIYMGYYLHDRVWLQNAALETAVKLSIKEDSASTDWNGMLWKEQIQKSATKQKNAVTVEVCGEFQMPGLAARFLTDGRLSLNYSVKKPVLHPKKEIQKWRNLEIIKGGME